LGGGGLRRGRGRIKQGMIILKILENLSESFFRVRMFTFLRKFLFLLLEILGQKKKKVSLMVPMSPMLLFSKEGKG